MGGRGVKRLRHTVHTTYLGVRVRNLEDAVRLLRRDVGPDGPDTVVAGVGDVEHAVGGAGDGGDGAELGVGGEVAVGLEAGAGHVEAIALGVGAGVGGHAAVGRDATDPVDPLRVTLDDEEVTVGRERQRLWLDERGGCGQGGVGQLCGRRAVQRSA